MSNPSFYLLTTMNTEPKMKLPGKTDHDQAVSNFLLALDTAIARAKGAGLTPEDVIDALQNRVGAEAVA